MPKFTMVLQTSPKDAPGEYVNSLPPIKSPAEGLISGDTVPEKWVAEIATMEEIQKLLNKHGEELNARIAALEAKVSELSPKTEAQPENKQEPEAKQKDKPEQKAEAKSGRKPEQQAEQKPQIKAEKKEESRAEGKPEQKADTAKAK